MKKTLKFILPLWLGMVVNTLLGITDFYFLKQIDFNYLAVVGIAYIPFSLLSSIMVGIGIEANRSVAKGQHFVFAKILAAVVLLASALSIMAYGLAPALVFFASDHVLYPEIMAYFKALSFLLIPTSVLFLCTGLLRGLGLPKKTIKFNILAVSLNFIMDYFFIKVNLFGSPVKGCAYASFIADSLTVILYLIYLKEKGYLKLGDAKRSTLDFLKKAWAYSLEKICSSSTVLIISSFYISKIAVKDSSIYYGIERFFGPLKMFSFCYFEWVIYAMSKNIPYPKHLIKGGYGLLLAGFGCLMFFYLKLDTIGLIYLISYILFCMLFLVERGLVASYFALENSKKANRIVFVKSIAMLILFHTLFITQHLNLITVGAIQCLLLAVESLALYSAKGDSLSFKSLQ